VNAPWGCIKDKEKFHFMSSKKTGSALPQICDRFWVPDIDDTGYAARAAGLDNAEAFLGKGTAGRILEVFFKIGGLQSIMETNCSFYAPGLLYFEVCHIPMANFACPQISGRRLVEAAGIEPASKNLPTEHLHT